VTYGEDGKRRLLGANMDVTDLVRTNEELRATNQALLDSRQANDLLAAYAKVTAHDLRAPARKVLQFADRLRRSEGELSERGEESLQRIEAAATTMMSLIDGIRQLGRITHDAQPSVRTSLAVPLRQVLRNHDALLTDIGGSVEAGPMPTVRGNASLWAIAFDNLLRNAIAHRSPDRALRVSVTTDTREGTPRVVFADNGSGLPDGDLERLFSLFERGHSGPGDGIGLALVTRVATSFGYRWSAERGDPGARFVLHLDGDDVSAC
jgi:signal transduction histidine kinase